MSDPVLELPFVAGFDESVQEEIQGASTAFSTLENGRYSKRGGYEKRLGFEALSASRIDASTRTSGRRLFMNGDQLCTIDGTYVDARSDVGAVVRGRVPEASVRLRDAPTAGLLFRMNTTAYSVDTLIEPCSDVVTCGNYTAHAWATGSDADGTTQYAMAALTETATGTVLVGPTALDTGDIIRVGLASYSTYIIAAVYDLDAGEIRGYKLDTTSAATLTIGWQSIGTLANDVATYATTVTAPAVVNLGASAVAIAYANDSGSFDWITVKRVNQTGVITTTTLTATNDIPGIVSLSEHGSQLLVAWVDDPGGSSPWDVNARELNASSLSAITPIFTAFSGVGSPAFVFVSGRAATGKYVIYFNNFEYASWMQPIVSSAGSINFDGSPARLMNAVIRGRPLEIDGRMYGHFTGAHYGTDYPEEFVLCDCTPDGTGAGGLRTYLRPVANPIVRGLFANYGFRICRVGTTDRYFTMFTVRKSGTTFGSMIAEYDFADSDRWSPCQVNGVTCLGGGVTSILDGTRVIESGFLCAPKRMRLDAAGVGSLTLSIGRTYVCTYEEVDSNGNWHVSGVSPPSASSGPIGGGSQPVFGLPLCITSRGLITAPIYPFSESVSALRIAIWATLDGNGPTYYRLAEVENDPNELEWGYVDEVSDAVLATRAKLYSTGSLPSTQGSSLDHRAPPGLIHLVAFSGMIVGANGKTLWFSSQPIDGEGQWWSSAFTQVVDEEITGLAVQDGTLMVFSRGRVWAVSGEPPADNFSSGGLGVPRRLAIEYGCVNAKSIVTTEAGTFYESDRGIELLTRGQTVQFVGDKVQDTLAAYPVITAATLDSRNGLVRFELAETSTEGIATGDGSTLVFDLIVGAWVSRDIPPDDGPAQDAAMVLVDEEWRYARLGADGVVQCERLESAADAHLDGSDWVTMRAITTWMHIAGVHGEQFIDQVLLLARRITGHDLTISLAFDYSDVYTSFQTFTAAQVGALAREWLVKEVAQTTSNAIRVKLEDATPSSGDVGTGKGSKWICLTLNGQPHRGPKRSTGAQRGGA